MFVKDGIRSVLRVPTPSLSTGRAGYECPAAVVSHHSPWELEQGQGAGLLT